MYNVYVPFLIHIFNLHSAKELTALILELKMV